MSTCDPHSVFKWTESSDCKMFTECLLIGMYTTTALTTLYIDEYLRARIFAHDSERIFAHDSERIKKIE